MTEHDLQDLLREVLDELVDAANDEDEDHPLYDLAMRLAHVDRVATYDEVGMLTSDPGLVVRLDDDSEYQITIVRSR